MARLFELVPDVDVLTQLPPEELGEILLKIVQENRSYGSFHLLRFMPSGSQEPWYPDGRKAEIAEAISEAWRWLEINMLLVPPPLSDGSDNGHRVLSRLGRRIGSEVNFRAFQDAAAFPKEMLHRAIADQVWPLLARGDLPMAVFAAFRAVEEAVRSAGGFSPADVGVDLMRKAFQTKGGPLTKESDLPAEREALQHLFAGAIGSYKNTHSHRTVAITDHREAQEQVVLASHLLRIVEGRRRDV